jgi:hypothetical protein
LRRRGRSHHRSAQARLRPRSRSRHGPQRHRPLRRHGRLGNAARGSGRPRRSPHPRRNPTLRSRGSGLHDSTGSRRRSRGHRRRHRRLRLHGCASGSRSTNRRKPRATRPRRPGQPWRLDRRPLPRGLSRHHARRLSGLSPLSLGVAGEHRAPRSGSLHHLLHHPFEHLLGFHHIELLGGLDLLRRLELLLGFDLLRLLNRRGRNRRSQPRRLRRREPRRRPRRPSPSRRVHGRQLGRPRRPGRRRGPQHRWPGLRHHRRGRLRRIPQQPPRWRQHRARSRPRRLFRRRVVGVVTQELPGRQSTEHPLRPRSGPHGRGRGRRLGLLHHPAPRLHGRGRGTRRRRRSQPPGRRHAQRARLAPDAIALGLVVEQPQLGRDVREDSQARDEPQRVRVLDFEGARHGHPQPAPLLSQREGQVLLRERRRKQRERRVRDGLEVGLLRHRVAGLLPQHHRQRVDVQHLQLDEDGAQPPTVDELCLQGFVELRLREEALADQDCSELFGHAPRSLDGFAPHRTGPRAPSRHFAQVRGYLAHNPAATIALRVKSDGRPTCLPSPRDSVSSASRTLAPGKRRQAHIPSPCCNRVLNCESGPYVTAAITVRAAHAAKSHPLQENR